EASLAAEGEEQRRRDEERRRLEEERRLHADRLREATTVLAQYQQVAAQASAASGPHSAPAPAAKGRSFLLPAAIGLVIVVAGAIVLAMTRGPASRNGDPRTSAPLTVSSQVADLVTRASLAASSGD